MSDNLLATSAPIIKMQDQQHADGHPEDDNQIDPERHDGVTKSHDHVCANFVSW